MPRRFPYRRQGQFFEGIPTVQEWQQLTQLKTLMYVHRRDNAFLLAIDTALEEYEHAASAPFDRSTESAEAIKTKERITALLLLAIAKKASAWSESKSGSRSKRRKFVENLLMETQKALASLDITLPQGSSEQLTGGRKSEYFGSIAAKLRWQSLREGVKHLGFGGRLKTLDSPYWAETNIGGANPQHIQGGTLNREWQENAEGRRDKFLFNYTRRRAARGETGAQVKYVGEADRWKYQILFDMQGKLYRRTSRQSTATSEENLIDSGSTAWIFVVDKAGNCYTSFGESPEDGKLFHHSSILSGSSLMFAGAIRVELGVLKEIDNGSGHYKPKKEHLLEVLKLLKTQKHVSLRGVVVMFLAGMKQMGGMEVPDIHLFSDADQYLRMRGNLPQG
jgi:hypothetical protein